MAVRNQQFPVGQGLSAHSRNGAAAKKKIAICDF